MSKQAEILAVQAGGPIDATVVVPGSKSITNRALPLAFLAEGESVLTGCLRSDDTQVMCEALRALGAPIDIDDTTFRVSGIGPNFAPADAPLYVGNSGTSARFLTAMMTLGAGPVVSMATLACASVRFPICGTLSKDSVPDSRSWGTMNAHRFG